VLLRADQLNSHTLKIEEIEFPTKGLLDHSNGPVLVRGRKSFSAYEYKNIECMPYVADSIAVAPEFGPPIFSNGIGKHDGAFSVVLAEDCVPPFVSGAAHGIQLRIA